jgi:hypothetical protein
MVFATNQGENQRRPKRSSQRFVPESDAQLREMRRAAAKRNGPLNEVGRRVMARALKFARRGIKVMPGFVNTRRGNKKQTCGPWALMTSDPAEIEAWGGTWNNGLIFTPTGDKLVTLDVDNKNGKRGSDDLAALIERYGPLPLTPAWKTPSGGFQFMLDPGGRRIPKSVGMLGRREGQESSSLDVIALGAVTVLPGSERHDGPVEWLPGQSIDDLEIAQPPDWLEERMLKAADEHGAKQDHADREGTTVPFDWSDCAIGSGAVEPRAEAYLRAAIEGKEEDIRAAPNGAQERTLNGAAWHLGAKIATFRSRGFTVAPTLAEEARRSLIEAGQGMPSHDPAWPWRRGEVIEKVDDAIAAGLESPTASLPADMWPQSSRDPRPGAAPPNAANDDDVDDAPEPGTFEDDEDHPPRQNAQHEGRPDDVGRKDGPSSGRSLLESLDAIALTDSGDYLIKGLIERGQLAAVFGPSSAGKSFIVLDAAAHIARGEDYAGRKVRQTAVLYVGLEGVPGIRRRMVAIRNKKGPHGDLLQRMTIPVVLVHEKLGADGERLIIEAANDLAECAKQPVGLIIIDTVWRAMSGADENSAQAMGEFVGHLQNIAAVTGAAVLVVHHPGKDLALGMRGSNSLHAACDTVIEVHKTSSGRPAKGQLEIIKSKDGESGPLGTFALPQVHLGIDDDGEAITSCIVELSTPKKSLIRERRKRPRNGSPAELALVELEQLLYDKGKLMPGHSNIPDNARVVSIAEWKQACARKGLAASTTEDPKNRARAESQAWKRAFSALEGSNWVAHYGDYVWKPWPTANAELASREETEAEQPEEVFSMFSATPTKAPEATPPPPAQDPDMYEDPPF